MTMKNVVRYAKNALIQAMDACSGEQFLIISDDVRVDVGSIFAQAGLEAGLHTRFLVLETKPSVFRKELSANLKEAVTLGRPDLAINCLRGPAEETPFRIKLIDLETKDRITRLGHGPGITADMLSEGALSLSTAEYQSMNTQAERIISATKNAEIVKVSAPSGTEIQLSIKGREFFTDTKITREKWGNLPTGEVLVGPVENSLEGTIICDVAIGGIGSIKTPVTIECLNGKAIKVEGEDPVILKRVNAALSVDNMASIVGEIALGLNPKARVVHEFLETEKVLGTAHVAFGRNIDYPTGGKNNSANHMDFLLDRPTMAVQFSDGRKVKIAEEGEILI